MRRILLAAALLVSLSLFGLAPRPAYAASDPSSCPTSPNSSAQQVLHGVGSTGGDCNANGPNQLISTIVNILSIVIGAVAIIMIMVSGFRYITSGGDSGKVAGAKNTLIYAIIGLVIVALAQLIVNLVVGNASTLNCSPGQQLDTNSGQCVPNCPSGQQLDMSSGSCVPDPSGH